MKIDKKMNVAIPVDRDGGTVYVHSTPISRDVFERYFVPISQTFAELYGAGGANAFAYSKLAAPRVALLTLKKIAQAAGQWDGPGGVENGLVAEIMRLTNVVAPAASGWEVLPLDDAVRTGVIDEDDKAEVENALVFFTVASSMHRRRDLGSVFDGLTSLWDAQITPLNSTEFKASLPTSTATASSGARAAGSSVPS